MRIKYFILFLFNIFISFFISAQNKDTLLHYLNEQLNTSIISDGFNPPQASRIYAYSNIAAYEVLANGVENFQSFSGQLNGFENLPKPEKNKALNFEVAACASFCKTARSLVYRTYIIDEAEKELMKSFSEKINDSLLIQNSKQFGISVAEKIIAWFKADNFTKLKTMPRYELMNKPGFWEPTPPAYADALEPNWGKIRSLLIYDSKQFAAPGSPAFSTDTTSAFYREAFEVFKKGKTLSQQEKEITMFWDDNAVHNNPSGHFSFVSRKLTPGGHWINITKIACTKAGKNNMESAEAYSLVSLALFEGFRVCWQEKYMYQLLRPETYINNYIDKNWRPLLETPPFPEYTSGHSAISSAAGNVLENLFGKNFEFTDLSEEEFGLGVRKFSSFTAAANEAGISRFYGGIHFMSAINDGKEQGRSIADFISRKISTRIK